VTHVLREISAARQVPGDEKRRWFTSPNLDLFVWIDDGGAPIGFQLCYDKQFREQALTWTVESGYSHMAIDGGEGRPARYKGAPILVANGTFEAGRILGEFQQEAVSLPPEFVQFIQDKMSPLAKA
jgi:hypothetical protein